MGGGTIKLFVTLSWYIWWLKIQGVPNKRDKSICVSSTVQLMLSLKFSFPIHLKIEILMAGIYQDVHPYLSNVTKSCAKRTFSWAHFFKEMHESFCVLSIKGSVPRVKYQIYMVTKSWISPQRKQGSLQNFELQLMR